MKNVGSYQLKKCIFKPLDEFGYDLRQLPIELRVEVSYDGLDFSPLDEDDEDREIIVEKLLSDYYEVTVTSVHADDWEDVGIWICYREE